MSECVVLVGLPAAGKTTFFHQYFAATHHHVSKDLWPNARSRDARQRRVLDEALGAGTSVCVDNTNATAADRAPIIAIARVHGASLVGYFFDVTTRQAVARNAERHDRQKVANVAIFTIAKRLQPPTLEEGFEQLFRVTLNEDGTFKVTKIT